MDSLGDVLLIDDDVDLCVMLTEYLSRYGFNVVSAYRGDAGLETARRGAWAMILLDVMLPGLDGFEVLKQIRTFSSVNVLLLTARGEEIDRIVGLEIGADDYVPKPFNPRELLARMRAILRRSAAQAGPESAGPLRAGNLVLDASTRTVTQAGRRLDLTDAEFVLLELFLQKAGTIVERDELAKAVLGRELSPFDRSLDMQISRLRKKLAVAGQHEEALKTVRGTGFLFTAPRPSRDRRS